MRGARGQAQVEMAGLVQTNGGEEQDGPREI
jgi:hypothetical protein